MLALLLVVLRGVSTLMGFIERAHWSVGVATGGSLGRQYIDGVH
jgi:hypothetical protein